MGLWGSCGGLLMVMFLTDVPPGDSFSDPIEGYALPLLI